MQDTIYWYDYETTGIDSGRDRPVQFGGLRTDLDLNVIGEATTLFCRLSDDILPTPEAMLVSGVSPATLEQQGVTEAKFTDRVHREFSQPGTCVAGYNSIRFDDEFTRHALYRNFFDPYAREWQAGNSRWDVIDLFRMAYALRPDGMEWPEDERGVVSFRLEELTRVNHIEHGAAHDALADVRATIDLTGLLRDEQPRLYDFLFQLRSKQRVLEQMYPLGKSAIVHVSSMYGASNGCLAVVLPICSHPGNSNGIVVYDLSQDPELLLTLPADEITRLVFTSREELAEGESRIPLKTVHINRCPAVAPLTTLTDANCERLGINMTHCLDHMVRIQHAAGIVEKIQDALGGSDFPEVTDPDLMLYQGGFFSSADKQSMALVRQASPQQLGELNPPFEDARLSEMLFRYRARNYPDTLTADEKRRWNVYRTDLWRQNSPLDQYSLEIDRLKDIHRGNADKLRLLCELGDYCKHLLTTLDG